eukprot:g6526.t1
MQRAQISEFHGFRAIGVQSSSTRAFYRDAQSRPSRQGLVIEAFKKITKKKQIILLENVQNLGQKGDLVTVAMGYWRNYLQPFRKAEAATEEVLESIRAEAEAELRAKKEIKDQALRMELALRTIGKFTIRKKSGEKDVIFGSVTKQDIADAIYQQTGQQLEKQNIKIPEIKTLGTFNVTVKLHPEVIGAFKVVVVKERNPPGKK